MTRQDAGRRLRKRRDRRDSRRFGPVAAYPYGLTASELVREVRRRRADGWQAWEIGARFGGRWAS